MHILLILPESGLKIPIRTQLSEVFGTYLSKKHRISVILFAKENREYEWNGFHIYEIKFTKRIWILRYSIRFIQKFITIIRKEKVDLIYGRNCYVIGNLFYPIAKFIRVPLVLQLTFPIREIVHSSFILSRILLFILKNTMTISDLILPISTGMGDYIHQLWKVKREKIYDFPDGVNTEKFKCASLEHKKYEDKTEIIYVGLINKRRNLSFLIKAMKLVVEKDPTVQLLIVGDGDDKKDLEYLTSELGLNKNISFVGRIAYSKVPEYLNMALVGVLPLPPVLYYQLCSPLKLFEYMGAGLAVIANEEVREHQIALGENEGGMLVPYEVQDFADAIVKLLNDKEKLMQIGKRNLEWVKKNREYEEMANKLETALINLVKTSRR